MGKFPVEQVKSLYTQVTKPWFDVRREDIVDGLKKAVVTSEYGEPNVKFISSGADKVELTSEDMMGNKGNVSFSANVSEQHEATLRAELIRDLIDNSRGERLTVSLCEGRFIKMDSDGVSSILMAMAASKSVKAKKEKKDDTE